MSKTRRVLKLVEQHPGSMARDLATLMDKDITYSQMQVRLEYLHRKGLVVREQPDNSFYRYRIKT